MRIFLFIAITTASPCAFTTAFGAEISGKWVLYIENPEHHVVTTANIVFTGRAAASCMSGKWQVVEVVSTNTKNKEFFPTAEPLSYRVENGQLTIGRNEVCDAYLWLQGKLGGTTVQGNYFSLGLGGSSPRGYFKMIEIK